jgi:hypothetical protein
MMAEEPNWDAIAEMYPVVDAMQHAGEPLTRENYIRNAYPKATIVLPVPVAMVMSNRRSPFKIVSIARLMAICW